MIDLKIFDENHLVLLWNQLTKNGIFLKYHLDQEFKLDLYKLLGEISVYLEKN